ncbi:MAG TPA: patatin-like phospholipase family protein [Gemmataceae bacterium]|nr:patatin-like phospholipase family protein [Gemmataceae bacterium]
MLALCLSGGGFRATLFHLGALRRLNELGVLARVEVISSVSGGSILNGVLATRWSRLTPCPRGCFTNFDDLVAREVRLFCRRDLRTPLLLWGRLKPAYWGAVLRNFGSVPANALAAAYGPLCEGQQLARLPGPGPRAPRFVFCATSVQTGACWQFHGGAGGRMGDFYSGYSGVGRVTVAEAVAASSAFPPGFGALQLRPPRPEDVSRLDPWGEARPASLKRQAAGGVGQPILLTDGGVYDNLGVEPVWGRCRALLVSDAGRPFASVPTCSQALVARLRRAAEISTEQVGAVRKRWLIQELLGKRCAGAVWAINTRLEDYAVKARGLGLAVRPLLPEVRTDLNAFTPGEIACLENHGYSLTDAALHARAPELCSSPCAPFRWPHPKWCDDQAVAAALGRSASRRVLRDVWRALTGRCS